MEHDWEPSHVTEAFWNPALTWQCTRCGLYKDDPNFSWPKNHALHMALAHLGIRIRHMAGMMLNGAAQNIIVTGYLIAPAVCSGKVIIPYPGVHHWKRNPVNAGKQWSNANP